METAAGTPPLWLAPLARAWGRLSGLTNQVTDSVHRYYDPATGQFERGSAG